MNEQNGLLQPKNMGFAEPLYRSVLFARILSVPGTVAVRGIILSNFSSLKVSFKAPAGYVLDFRAGVISLNGSEFTYY